VIREAAEFVRDLLERGVGQFRNEPRDELERPILDAIAQALEAGDAGERIGLSRTRQDLQDFRD
jgi:hypothetical protein